MCTFYIYNLYTKTHMCTRAVWLITHAKKWLVFSGVILLMCNAHTQKMAHVNCIFSLYIWLEQGFYQLPRHPLYIKYVEKYTCDENGWYFLYIFMRRRAHIFAEMIRWIVLLNKMYPHNFLHYMFMMMLFCYPRTRYDFIYICCCCCCIWCLAIIL